MNNMIANIRTQLRKLKCRITNLTKRVAYIEDNCCNGGGGGDGIQSIIPGDNISVDNTDPQNPVVSSTGGGGNLTLEQARQNWNVLSGDIEFDSGYHRISQQSELSGEVWIDFSSTNRTIGIGSSWDYISKLTVSEDNISIYGQKKGLLGTDEFDKQGDRKAFAQIADLQDGYIPLPTEGTAGQVLTTDGDGAYTWEDISGGDNYVSVLDVSSIPTADKVVQYSSTGNVNTGTPTLPENSVNLAYLNTTMSSKVDVVPDMGLSKENFTTEEKSKLAGLESPKFKGQYLSLTDLQNAGNGEIGGYAYVDNGVTIDMYIWDNTNEVWDIVVGESTTETPASIKSKYESNPDTNAFTDALKNKLEAFTSNFTAELKNTYDTTSNIVTTHQATIGKVWTPDYSNMETTNRITTSGGTWTVPAGYKGWVNLFSRGYNGSSTYNMDVFIINGKPLGKIWVEATSGSGAARSGSLNGFYPVKEGDVIQVYGNLERSCYFIPGIWV